MRDPRKAQIIVRGQTGQLVSEDNSGIALKNLLVLNRILLIKKRICVNAEKLVDKVAASLISNLLQGRKTLSSKISTAVKFI